uniref:Uncharacterized protein n=1 Tax=Sphaerodactylus townsendi TaxID=933632 RepID=A0ACB8F4K1_9SAUR
MGFSACKACALSQTMFRSLSGLAPEEAVPSYLQQRSAMQSIKLDETTISQDSPLLESFSTFSKFDRSVYVVGLKVHQTSAPVHMPFSKCCALKIILKVDNILETW